MAFKREDMASELKEMAFRREDMTSELKDIQITYSSLPRTPAKPDPTRQQPICSNWQENQLVDANWLEPEMLDRVTQENWWGTGQLSNTFLQETQCQTIPACYNSTNSISTSGGYNTWQAGDAINSYVHGHNLSIYDKFSNVSFGDLLAATHAARIPAAAANAVSRMDFIATSSSSAPHLQPQTKNCQFMMSFGNYSPANQDSLLGAMFNAALNSTPGYFTGGSSISSRPFFDLNSPPRTVTDSSLIKNVSSQFEPITPEKTNKTEQRQESAMPDLSIDKVHTTNNPQENKVANEVMDFHEKNKQPQLCATTPIQPPENHKPDKEGTEEAELSKTPQQMPRKKKHRPKVIIEGQPKKTPRASTEIPTFPTETTTVKRKYVRRKGVNNLTDTPLEGLKNETDANKTPSSSRNTPTEKRKYVRKKGIDKPEATMLDEGTSDTNKRKSVRHNRSSCRRSLNFDLEGQEKDESSSFFPPSNYGMESQEENLNAIDHPRETLQCRQGMEVMMEKYDMGIAYELTPCTNQVLNDYLSRPEIHSPCPLPHTKTGPPQDDCMFTDQSASTRGKCQIVFSDVTHDKESNSVQVTMNPDCHWTPKSPNESNCCSSTCLTSERQDRGFKRQHVDATIEAEICSTNETGTLYNPLQTYCSLFLQNSDKNEGTHGMHFPVIYKKMRTEKGHNTATSRLQSTMTAISTHVKLENHHFRDSCAKFKSETKQGYYSVAQWEATNPIKDNPEAHCDQNEQKNLDLLAFGSTEWMKKKRSKGPTRVRDLASLLEICKEQTAAPDKRATTSRNAPEFEILHQPHTCVEALEVDAHSTMTTKKRSKRSVHINSTVQDMYNHQGFDPKFMGPSLSLNWRYMSLFDAITEQLEQLDLNAESSQASAQEQSALTAYHMYYQEQLALVPYQRGGAVVPFDSSFNQVRKRRSRPKVELDDETTRVWKLLLENINSEGIDGTDEEKTKWWEEERRIFTGRADSFIARMHLVQGDRRFSPWKGSVLDSVIGVFLTQNVSDHLSSSAFMSLAAQFPLESKINLAEVHEERVETKISEPEKHVLNPDGTFELNGEVLNKPVCGEDPKILQDFEYNEIRVVNSVKYPENSSDGIVPEDNLQGQLAVISRHSPVIPNTSATNKSISLIGDKRDTDDAFSSQPSVISSQNSADSPTAQTTERTESSLPSTLEEEPTAGVIPNRFTSPTSFVKLLQMTETVLHGNQKKGRNMFDVPGQVQPESLSFDSQKEVQCDDCTSPAISITTCNMSTLHLVSTPGAQTSECFDISKKKSKISDTSSRLELSTAEVSGFSMSSESESQDTLQKVGAASFEEGPKLSCDNNQIEINKRTVENQMGQVSAQILFQENKCKMDASNNPIYPQNLMDATGSSSTTQNSKISERDEVSLNKNDHNYPSSNKGNVPKPKGGRIGKGKQNPFDWDSLRKQAQAGGRKRERTANTMDSVDWNAVRCADVNEIAQTIKERGMNNMLAERIKDFLNRLVREHGSLDLEWLRDVPPDKAKEYLLSVRGLGLKSVECVRLLTLHHLAFPVDTNVGRIAVRLGWVPLQPLPESLQLHLLELYPVLESIQKYLWPRLCKLDQKTLYELHYQMITFGKVFCTKSKPNCNACPMRGECRHFASAFASARLSLPAPEEKSITISTENKEDFQNPMKNMISLSLPPPQANQMDAKSGVSNSQPIIEEPATPEPAIEVPATPEPSCTQVPECDIENNFYEDPDEIPTIQLNMVEFTHNLQKIMQQNPEIEDVDTSKALVALTPEAALIPVPKLKNVSQLRTEHQVYELPDSHPLLEGMDKREPDDPCPYLLAIWTPGETVNSIEPPERQCSSQESEKLCTDETCLSCNSIREANSLTVRGTLLIPCRTAMRGSFPLNGTYFQVNEVFSDHESSLCPMNIPRKLLWNLPRRTVYFGTSIPTIFKGLSTEGIQYCFWRGFVCVRGFDRKKRAPRPLIARLHFPASKLAKGKGKTGEN